MMRVLIIIFALLVAGYFGMSTYVDSKLAQKSYPTAYNQCEKIWSARGLYPERRIQNSIKSVSDAFNAGARGVEIDLYYDIGMKRFVVSHDFPYLKKEGEFLSLEKLLDATAGDYDYWLDFKRLGHLSESQALDAAHLLNRISTQNGIHNRIYVEGEDPIRLSTFKNAGLKTILDIRPLPDDNLLAPILLNIYKAAFYFGDFTVMALAPGPLDNLKYGERAQESLGNIPLFLYHIPDDPDYIKTLIAKPSIRVMMIGKAISINRFDISNCSESRVSTPASAP